jgi:hypothetical protein
MCRAKHSHQRVSFDVASKNVVGSSQRNKRNRGEIPMSSSTIEISVSIPSKFLVKVDEMNGKNRNEKILKRVRVGYDILRK